MGVIMEVVMIKGCIFDLDGTLVDSLKDLAVSTNHALEACGLPPHPIENYKQYVGNGVLKLVERALGEDHQDLFDQCLQEFMDYYKDHCISPLHDGRRRTSHYLGNGFGINNIVLFVVFHDSIAQFKLVSDKIIISSAFFDKALMIPCFNDLSLIHNNN